MTVVNSAWTIPAIVWCPLKSELTAIGRKLPRQPTTSTVMATSLALKRNGTLWAWGNNLEGQLGLGDRVNRLIPTEVGGQ